MVKPRLVLRNFPSNKTSIQVIFCPEITGRNSRLKCLSGATEIKTSHSHLQSGPTNTNRVYIGKTSVKHCGVLGSMRYFVQRQGKKTDCGCS